MNEACNYRVTSYIFCECTEQLEGTARLFIYFISDAPQGIVTHYSNSFILVTYNCFHLRVKDYLTTGSLHTLKCFLQL